MPLEPKYQENLINKFIRVFKENMQQERNIEMIKFISKNFLQNKLVITVMFKPCLIKLL